ncbi:hypothetical protein A3754_18720 [Alcanivorax sp. HI0083]|uniref:hypothetical protein n=1 Tax=unclassified Alcanivorax TaxID=2638842 RepID=UPI0007B86E2E|nr:MULTISPECIES: hypothetical protein [unclassified Alcanivorax]KZY35122.1 hypothetical protein A3730_15350 [Alcanivorax sp. HI0044]KZY38290.1 hypothetical protein A3730_25805 [Alcanivorax sp. HI0044]KZZ23326.1 hypothetical protein A3754_18720 [Alcanivorax sp. HI0083]
MSKKDMSNGSAEYAVMNMSKRPNFIYLAGMVPVFFVVGLLVFLTFDNLFTGRAVYGDKFGNAYEVQGVAAILVNFGILGLVGWLGSFLAFLIWRSPRLMRFHRAIGVVSSLCVVGGLVYGLS